MKNHGQALQGRFQSIAHQGIRHVEAIIQVSHPEYKVIVDNATVPAPWAWSIQVCIYLNHGIELTAMQLLPDRLQYIQVQVQMSSYTGDNMRPI